MVTRPPCGSRESGHALLLALFVLLLSATAIALVGQALLMQWNETRAHAERVRIMALADAALAETLAELAQQPGFIGLASTLWGGGVLESRVRTTGGVGPNGRQIRIDITATVGGRSRSYVARARIQDGRPPTVLQWRPEPVLNAP